MDFLSDQCRANKQINLKRPMRVPGDAAARASLIAEKDEIEIDAASWHAIGKWPRKLGVGLPNPV